MTNHTKSAGEVKARNETERQAAYKLADSLLNKPFHDPDADQVMLARQFLRALEREDVLREQVKELREGLKPFASAADAVTDNEVAFQQVTLCFTFKGKATRSLATCAVSDLRRARDLTEKTNA